MLGNASEKWALENDGNDRQANRETNAAVAAHLGQDLPNVLILNIQNLNLTPLMEHE